MQHSKTRYIKNILFPSFILSSITGIFTAILIFLFKVVSGFVIDASARIYTYVRGNPQWLPCLILGAALVGLIPALILRNAKNCRGGGIPTSVAILRGLIEFNWVKNIFYLLASTWATFFAGIPLGNEGPSVQIGTAVGRGTVRVFAKNHRAWDKYIMTGGACGGFAVATGAPLTGILFAFEEAHRRFSSLIFIVAAITVTVANLIMQLLCGLTNVSPYLFEIHLGKSFPLQYIWVAAVIGIVCGLSAIAFTALYAHVGRFLNETLKKLPFVCKIIIIFAMVGLLGFISEGFIGSGHDIIYELMQGNGLWYILLLYLFVRALMLMFANRVGISGGIFVPTLTFGALIGALFAKVLVGTNIIPQEYFVIPIAIGMAAFLAASARTPITAIAFSIEVLGGIFNTIPIAVGVTLSFLIIEAWGGASLHDMVITQRVEDFNAGKVSTVVDEYVTVIKGSFADGKEVRNILWPPTCTVLSVRKPQDSNLRHEVGNMEAGDILHIHYQTYDQKATHQIIEDLVGHQAKDTNVQKRTVDQNNHIVPDI